MIRICLCCVFLLALSCGIKGKPLPPLPITTQDAKITTPVIKKK